LQTETEREQAIKWWFSFLPHLTNVSALPAETRTFQYLRVTLLSDIVVMAKIKFVTSKNNGNGAQCVHLKMT